MMSILAETRSKGGWENLGKRSAGLAFSCACRLVARAHRVGVARNFAVVVSRERLMKAKSSCESVPASSLAASCPHWIQSC